MDGLMDHLKGNTEFINFLQEQEYDSDSIRDDISTDSNNSNLLQLLADRIADIEIIQQYLKQGTKTLIRKINITQIDCIVYT